MRTILPCLAMLALTACGGSNTAEPTMMLETATTVFQGNDHTCASPSPSGSPGQIACHKAATAACPAGTSPDRVDFSEDAPGHFVVRGYSCV